MSELHRETSASDDQKPLVTKETTKLVDQPAPGTEKVSNFFLYSLMSIMSALGTLSVIISKK